MESALVCKNIPQLHVMAVELGHLQTDTLRILDKVQGAIYGVKYLGSLGTNTRAELSPGAPSIPFPQDCSYTGDMFVTLVPCALQSTEGQLVATLHHPLNACKFWGEGKARGHSSFLWIPLPTPLSVPASPFFLSYPSSNPVLPSQPPLTPCSRGGVTAVGRINWTVSRVLRPLGGEG